MTVQGRKKCLMVFLIARKILEISLPEISPSRLIQRKLGLAIRKGDLLTSV